jgi:pimeloyl-ACP methyl ester carboxylesterase
MVTSTEMPDAEVMVVGGSSIRVSVRGTGPPVLLLPGIGSSLEMWGPLRRQLGERTTIAFDPPGIGASPFDRRIWSIGHVARLAAAVVDRWAPDVAPDVIGYSFGGLVAQHLARLRVVRRLALVATTAGQPAVPPMPHRLLAMLQGGLLLQQGRKGNSELGQLFGGRSAREPAALTAAMRQLSAVPPSTAGYYGQALAASLWTGLPWLRLLTMPTLVLTGSDDRLVPASNSRVITALAPGARLRILRGAGHLLVLDDAERTGTELRTFLDTGRETRRP